MASTSYVPAEGPALGMSDIIGRLDEAKPLFDDVLTIRRHALGEDSPLFATALSNLAELWRELRDFSCADRLHRSALAIRIRSLGVDHPHVARSLISIGKLQRGFGHHAEAHRLLEEALDILLNSVGESFPLTKRLRAMIDS